MTAINTSRCSKVDVPFTYIQGDKIFTGIQSEILLKWLMHDITWNSWKHKEYEFDSIEIDFQKVPEAIGAIINKSWLNRLAIELSDIFQVQLLPSERMLAHVFRKNHRINIHNDNPVNSKLETHRIVIYLNDPAHKLTGGELVLYNSYNIFDIHRVISPVNNSFFAFAASPGSYHSVNTVSEGERFTLNFSFFDDRYLIEERNLYNRLKKYNGEEIRTLATRALSPYSTPDGRSLYDYSLSVAMTVDDLTNGDEEAILIALFHCIYTYFNSDAEYEKDINDEIAKAISKETKMKALIYATMDKDGFYKLLEEINRDVSRIIVIRDVCINASDIKRFLLINIAIFLEDLMHSKKIYNELYQITNAIAGLDNLLGDELIKTIKGKIDYNLQYIAANT